VNSRTEQTPVVCVALLSCCCHHSKGLWLLAQSNWQQLSCTKSVLPSSPQIEAGMVLCGAASTLNGKRDVDVFPLQANLPTFTNVHCTANNSTGTVGNGTGAGGGFMEVHLLHHALKTMALVLWNSNEPR